MLPLNWIVYCEAPTTVARMPSMEGSKRGQNASTRARISAEGKLYTCLFALRGTDLRALLRGGAKAVDVLAFARVVGDG